MWRSLNAAHTMLLTPLSTFIHSMPDRLKIERIQQAHHVLVQNFHASLFKCCVNIAIETKPKHSINQHPSCFLQCVVEEWAPVFSSLSWILSSSHFLHSTSLTPSLLLSGRCVVPSLLCGLQHSIALHSLSSVATGQCCSGQSPRLSIVGVVGALTGGQEQNSSFFSAMNVSCPCSWIVELDVFSVSCLEFNHLSQLVFADATPMPHVTSVLVNNLHDAVSWRARV
jgi:hypothetical protein